MEMVPKKSYQIFAKRLLEDFRSKITGENESRIVGDNPENLFFVGKLLSVNDDESDKKFNSKTFIESIGVDFYVSSQDIHKAALEIIPEGEFYYRVHPSLEEQRAYLLKRINEGLEEQFEDFQTLVDEYNNSSNYRGISCELCPVYKSVQIACDDFSFNINLGEVLSESKEFGFIDKESEINKKLAEKIESLSYEVQKESDIFKYQINEATKIDHLMDLESYNKFLENYSKKDVEIHQNWSFYYDISLKLTKKNYFVSINLVNDSTSFSGKHKSRKGSKATIETLFNSGLRLVLNNAEYQDIEMGFFKDDYKYERMQKAVGLNCSLEVEPGTNRIVTTHLPIYTQHRLVTNDQLAIRFSDLITNPIIVLESIQKKMESELSSWEKTKSKIYAGLTTKGKESITNEVREFEAEIERFKKGIKVLKDYPIVKKSFELMNKTFMNTAKGYSTWRLFQIVFIVTMLPDIVACDEYIMSDEDKFKTTLKDMSLLYFPTGGGKTEAFLGVLVFNLFFDRFRGKTCGVTSLLRYPLRLLSVQQVQRVANVLAEAEKLRRLENGIKDTSVFSLGYYVGDRNTPNRLYDKDIASYQSMSQQQKDEKKVIEICPFCGKETVHLDVIVKSRRLVHYCNNPDCCSGGILPIYIVDNEIYRYLPSVIISTVDKLTIMGTNANFRNILDGVELKCPLHGFTSKTKCVEGSSCKIDTNHYETVDMYDPAPTLLIQDELHLIRESLGTYASHYESFLNYYIRVLSKSTRGVKVIGATATISSYKEQVSNLYQSEAIRFPCESLDRERNFYSYIDDSDVQRYILGYAPYGRAIINSVVYSMKYMRQVVYRYFEEPSKILSIPNIGIETSEQALKLLENYWIFLEYNNVKRDGNNVTGALDTPINVELIQEGITPFKTRKMTGDEDFQDVREVLAEVENSENVFDGVNLIAATSMISHGVDADRFNIMFFYGMPGNIAEYIQAYSRTGRKYSSLVIDLMRPSRETDQSYLKNFVSSHDYKDILVEAVPLNRWASKAINGTLPGIFAALLLTHYDKQLQYSTGTLFFMKNIKRAYLNGELNNEEIMRHLFISYGCTDGVDNNDLGNQYRGVVEEFVTEIKTNICDRSWTDEMIFIGFRKMGYPIMSSLRDTDKQVIVELN